MAYTIVIASRYLIPLFLYLFLSCSIYALFVGDVRKQSGAAALQMVFLFLMQFTAWLTIVIRTQQSKYLLFYAFLQILTLALPVLAWLFYPGISRDCYESYVYAFQCGADRADTARSDKGDQTADYRGRILCRISDCAVDLAQMQVSGKTWLDLCRNRNCSPWNRADFRTGDARLEAVLVDRRNYLPAVGVCQTDVRIFSGSGSFRKDRNRQVVAAGIGATAHVLILVRRRIWAVR